MSNERIVENLLKEFEGDFAIITAEPARILAARDPVGVQPLYYGENDELTGLANNKTALWKLGISKAYSFPSGNIASLSREGFEFKPIRTLSFSKPKSITLNEAARKLQRLLEDSVRVRVHGVKEVAVAFSGGLDSSIVAFLAKKCGVQVQLVHVSLRGQRETDEAKKAADELKLPLAVHLFEEADVEKTVSKAVALIEESDPVKAAIGIPFYWVAQKTAEAGLDVLLAGQGADELFGGYQRYVNEYISHGAAAVRKTMFDDVVRLPESNLERDKKICGFHGVELCLPFASFGIAEFALSLPVELKIERQRDGLRKLVLRRMALNLGLPEDVVNKPKKAVQYATGVNAVLGKIAKKQGLNVGEYVARVFDEGRN
jgi:asparagine synthase (glutamine-hydrolysing)